MLRKRFRTGGKLCRRHRGNRDLRREGVRGDALEIDHDRGVDEPAVPERVSHAVQNPGDSFHVTRNGVPVGELTPVRRNRFVSRNVALAAFSHASPIEAGRFRTDVDRLADQKITQRQLRNEGGEVMRALDAVARHERAVAPV